jgi:hypothetical protein
MDIFIFDYNLYLPQALAACDFYILLVRNIFLSLICLHNLPVYLMIAELERISGIKIINPFIIYFPRLTRVYLFIYKYISPLTVKLVTILNDLLFELRKHYRLWWYFAGYNIRPLTFKFTNPNNSFTERTLLNSYYSDINKETFYYSKNVLDQLEEHPANLLAINSKVTPYDISVLRGVTNATTKINISSIEEVPLQQFLSARILRPENKALLTSSKLYEKHAFIYDMDSKTQLPSLAPKVRICKQAGYTAEHNSIVLWLNDSSQENTGIFRSIQGTRSDYTTILLKDLTDTALLEKIQRLVDDAAKKSILELQLDLKAYDARKFWIHNIDNSIVKSALPERILKDKLEYLNKREFRNQYLNSKIPVKFTLQLDCGFIASQEELNEYKKGISKLVKDNNIPLKTQYFDNAIDIVFTESYKKIPGGLEEVILIKGDSGLPTAIERTGNIITFN